MNASPIRVVIADDHVLVRQGIRAFLDTQADLAIVAGDKPATASQGELDRVRRELREITTAVARPGFGARHV